MLTQLLIGGFLITMTIAVQAVIIGIVETLFNRSRAWLVKPPRIAKLVLALTAVVLCIMIGVSISAWLWAGVYMWLGVFESLETSVYYSIVNMTTLGFGDIIITKEWRILAALEAADGLIIFGLSTAYLMEFISELRTSQREYLDQHKKSLQRRQQIKKQSKTRLDE